MVELFGDRLLKLRKENGLTQDELVEQMNKRFDSGLNKSIVSRYENNIHKPTRVTLIQQISEFFGVTTEYLMGLSDEKFLGKNVQDELKRIPVLQSMTSEHLPTRHEYSIDKSVDLCLFVKDDSMIGARIFKNDLAYVRKQSDVEHGKIAVIALNDEEVIRRVYKYGSKIVLHAENPTLEDITISKNDKAISILGEVIYIKFQAR